MSRAAFELDFFQMERQRASSCRAPFSTPERNGSLRGIQSVVSRISPQMLKTVMASGAAAACAPAGKTTLDVKSQLPPLSVLKNPNSKNRSASDRSLPETAPLTIFYNGTVTVFDVPREQAEAIIKLAEESRNVRFPADRPPADPLLDGGSQLEGDLPIARRKSLHRFLEKRKERLSSVEPYHHHHQSISHLPSSSSS